MTRDSYFDILRGIAILLVIAIHTYPGGDFETAEGFVNICLRECCNVAVPLFLAISGYFIGKKDLSTRGKYISFLKKQIPRVYFPCILWSIPILVYGIYAGRSIISAAAILFSCSAFAPYYFIALIIQLYILTVFFKFLIISWLRLWGGIVLFMNTIAVIFLNYFIIGKFEMPFVFLVGPFFYWMSFYYLGLYISQNQDVIICRKMILWAIMVLFTFQLLECYHIGVGIKVTSWAWAFLIIVVLFSNKLREWFKNHENKFTPFAFLGKYSFGIYLSHVYVLIVLNKLPIETYWFVDWLFVTIATFLLVWLMGRILPKQYIKLFGIN